MEFDTGRFETEGQETMSDIILSFPRVSHTATQDAVRDIDHRYWEDIHVAVGNMSLTEMHRLRVAVIGCDKEALWDLIVGTMLHNRAKRGES